MGRPVPPQERHNDLTCGVCEVYPRAFIKTASNIDKAVDTHSLPFRYQYYTMVGITLSFSCIIFNNDCIFILTVYSG